MRSKSGKEGGERDAKKNELARHTNRKAKKKAPRDYPRRKMEQLT